MRSLRSLIHHPASITGLVAVAAALFTGGAPSAQDVVVEKPRRPLPSVAEAAARAELLHETVHSTLRVVHHEFYREDESLPIPAAALAKVFRDLEERQNITVRWLAVDGDAMNVDHKARGEFELNAVKAIQSGRTHAATEEGLYRRAAAITLTSECLKCHIPGRKSTENRSAGLVISMPVRTNE